MFADLATGRRKEVEGVMWFFVETHQITMKIKPNDF